MPLPSHVKGVKTAGEAYFLKRQKEITGGSRPVNQQESEQISREYWSQFPIRDKISLAQGDQVLEETPLNLRVKRADGSVVNYAWSADGGREHLKENVEYKPPTQQEVAQQNINQTAMDQVLQYLQNPNQVSQSYGGALSPDVMARLNEISTAQNQALDQQFNQGQAALLTQLYGQGIPQSSIANQAGGQLLQQQGLVKSQATSEAAQRELAVREYLASLGLQERGQNLSTIDQILGRQQSQSQFQSSLDLAKQQQQFAEEQARQNQELAEQQFLEQRRQARRAAIGNIIGSVTGLAGSVLSGGLAGGLFGGASSASNTNYGNYSSGGGYTGGGYSGLGG